MYSLQRIQKGHPTARPKGRGVECLFWVLSLSLSELSLSSFSHCFQYHLIFDCDISIVRAGVKYVLSNTNTNTNTFFSRVSNTNTNTPAKIWSNTNTNTAHQIQIQIHNEAETKLPPFYRWHIQIHCIVRRLFCLFKFHSKIVSKGPIHRNKLALVQIMAWCWVGNKP